MATTAPNPNIAIMFKELNYFGKNGDFEKALKVVNKINQELPDDDKVIHCKVVCLIQLSKFDEALSVIKKNSKASSDLTFEKAYCEYRLNRIDEALKTIKNGDQKDMRLRELLGQVLYRIEKLEECFDIYKDLLKNTQDDFEEERETNLSAVLAALQLSGKNEIEDVPLREETFEMCYNVACSLLGQGEYKAALEKLKLSEKLCRLNFEDDPEASQEEIQSELAIIWVQMGYVLQKLGKNDEAVKLYNQVIKQKPTDQALMAVASNNVITLNKDQNVFDSRKRIKYATSDALKHKLSSHQRQSIAVNECLLYMYAGQAEQCHRSAQVLSKNLASASSPSLPTNDSSSVVLLSAKSVYKPCLIEVAQYLKEKDSQKAIKLLEEQIEACNKSKEKASSTELKLALAQIYLGQEHVYKACDLLRSLSDGDSYKPGVVSTLVSLYLSQEDKEMATEVLNQAVKWHQENQPNSAELIRLIRSAADFHLNMGTPQMAAQMLEQLRKSDSKNLKTLAQLIIAYSKFDSAKALEVSKHFPTQENLARDIDIESLESTVSWLGSKYTAKKSGKLGVGGGVGDQSPKPPSTGGSGGGKVSVSELAVKLKNKKKKKKVLPKNFDPTATPDPERWLPTRERSYYRGKRKGKKRGDIGKGTQGSVALGFSELDASDIHHQQTTGLQNGPLGSSNGVTNHIRASPNSPPNKSNNLASSGGPNQSVGGATSSSVIPPTSKQQKPTSAANKQQKTKKKKGGKW